MGRSVTWSGRRLQECSDSSGESLKREIVLRTPGCSDAKHAACAAWHTLGQVANTTAKVWVWFGCERPASKLRVSVPERGCAGRFVDDAGARENSSRALLKMDVY